MIITHLPDIPSPVVGLAALGWVVLVYTLWDLLPQTAKTANISLNQSTHAHFLYDRGIPLWAGPCGEP